jgi:hypothetical protein
MRINVTAVELADSLEKLAAHYRSLGDAGVEPLYFPNYCVTKDEFLTRVGQMPHPLVKEYVTDELNISGSNRR